MKDSRENNESCSSLLGIWSSQWNDLDSKSHSEHQLCHSATCIPHILSSRDLLLHDCPLSWWIASSTSWGLRCNLGFTLTGLPCRDSYTAACQGLFGNHRGRVHGLLNLASFTLAKQDHRRMTLSSPSICSRWSLSGLDHHCWSLLYVLALGKHFPRKERFRFSPSKYLHFHKLELGWLGFILGQLFYVL